MYCRAHYDAPAGGSVNPFGPTSQYTDGMNRYEYAKSNACNHLDPTGKGIIGCFRCLNGIRRLHILAEEYENSLEDCGTPYESYDWYECEYRNSLKREKYQQESSELARKVLKWCYCCFYPLPISVYDLIYNFRQ